MNPIPPSPAPGDSMPDHDALEVQVTTLLLGELSADEAKTLRARIEVDPALRTLHDRLRIAIELTGSGYGGTIQYSVAGGNAGVEAVSGDQGTLEFILASGDSICDSGSLATTCIINTSKTLPTSLSLSGANLTVNPGVTVTSVGP